MHLLTNHTLDLDHFMGGLKRHNPGKASNAGGVSTSGLEMTQYSMRIHWSREEVDEWLQ